MRVSRLSNVLPTEYPKMPRTKMRRNSVSSETYNRAYNLMSDRQKKAMQNLYEKAFRANGMVDYRDVQECVAEIVMASLEENDD